MTSCPEALRIFEVDKKKTVSWDLNSERESWNSSLEEGSRIFGHAEARPVGVYEMCRAFVEEILSLSPHVEKP